MIGSGNDHGRILALMGFLPAVLLIVWALLRAVL